MEIVHPLMPYERRKTDIFAQLDKICKPGAFICSNTSALDIDEIASATSRPGKNCCCICLHVSRGVCTKYLIAEYVMGTHFFSPANVMKLLENVKGKYTSDLTIASMMQWGKKIGKWCILVGNCPGFVGNRMVGLYGGQARIMLEEGLLPSQVDGAATSFGMRVGPLAMSDIVGLDLGIQAAQKAGKYHPDRVIQHALIEAGRLGQKNGKGFFDYDAKTRKASPSDEVEALIGAVRQTNGTPQKEISEEQATQRLLFPMINEAFLILEEGMAQRPADIDVCYVHGYSFPRHRGGPMFYADAVGLPTVVKVLEGIGIKPAPLLLQCVGAGNSLASFWADKTKAKL